MLLDEVGPTEGSSSHLLNKEPTTVGVKYKIMLRSGLNYFKVFEGSLKEVSSPHVHSLLHPLLVPHPVNS